MHVNDRVAQPVTEDAASQAAASRVAAGLGRLIRAHRPFVIVLAVAAAVCVVVMLGYPPTMFFNDSYNYMTDAVTKSADIVRTNGYPLFLYALLPFHSLTLVTALQAVMGLAIGAGIYAVLSRRGLPWWGATIPALPVLFDVFELQLEHMIAADVLFYTVITAVLVLLCWWDQPPFVVAVLAGLGTGYAATVRSVGEPLLVIILIGMLARRMGWRRITATAVAGVAPIVAYMFWFHSQTGQYALNESTGTFLYSRVSSFSDCAKMNPPADLRVLCDLRPPSRRPGSQEYLWSNKTPLAELTGTNNVNRFTPQIESLTMRFAERAILAQPLDYARVVAKDSLTEFSWAPLNSNNAIGNLEGSGSKFRFGARATHVPGWVTSNPTDARAAQDFGGADYGKPSVIQPWARWLDKYQKYVFLPGPFLFVFVVVGAVGVALGIRRRTRVPGTGWGGLGLLSWLTGVALLVLPSMTAGFSYRYALAAVPAICLAAGLAFTGRESFITWLREHGLLGKSAG